MPLSMLTASGREGGSPREGVRILADGLAHANAVLVGASSGLSTSAGLICSGVRFARYFADFEAACGFHDMCSGGFFPFATSEE